MKIEQTTKCLPKQLKFSKQKLIIFCDPNYPIYFLESFLKLVKVYLSISVSTYVHSTIATFPSKLGKFCSDFSNVNADTDICITLIWKTIGIDPTMELSGVYKILGMINIARYLNRLIEVVSVDVLKYEQNGPLYANKIDYYLEEIHCVLHGISTALTQKICKKSRYVMGENISIVDLILESFHKYETKVKLTY